ncbi:MAG: alginate lyase family protein [Armatimonadetes bacterium]|nr:alginate lyase family protein [Armatimonadota bacterium]
MRAALEKGDVKTAEKAYITYFRTKTISSPLLTDWATLRRNPKADTATADQYLAGHLHDGYSVYEVPPTGLDWRNAPLSCVTRFPILPTLRYAAFNTENPKYLRFVVDHILGYMKAYPTEEFVGKNTREGWTDHFHVAKPWYWCMIPERLTELSQTLNLIRRYPQVSDEELFQILHRMYEETGYLRTQIKEWVDRRHNGGCAMIEAMAQSCAVLDDFKNVEEWRDYDAQLEAQYIDQSFYPDGMCVELTTAYSASVSVVGQRMAYALRDQKALQSHERKVAAMVTSMVAMSDPTGWLPAFGDLYAGTVGDYVYDPVVDWLNLPWVRTITRHTKGPLPPFTVWPQTGQEQWCGYYTMRSDWTPQARYMAIDGGPWGTTHQHGDKLSFVVTANGAKFIIDPSSTRYSSNEPDAFIGGQPSGFLHNTITVDGVDEFLNGPVEAKEPLHNLWAHGKDYTLFASSYSFTPVKPVNWERRVLFVDGAYWLLQDVLIGEQETTQVEQNFQFEADIKIEFQDNRTIAIAPNGARLVLLPLSGDLKPQLTIGDRSPHTTYWPSGKPTDILRSEDRHDQKHGRGWTGRSGSKLLPAPAVTYTGQVKLPAMISVAIIPSSPGQSLTDMPHIKSEATERETLWTLPTAREPVRFVTSVAKCLVAVR